MTPEQWPWPDSARLALQALQMRNHELAHQRLTEQQRQASNLAHDVMINDLLREEGVKLPPECP